MTQNVTTYITAINKMKYTVYGKTFEEEKCLRKNFMVVAFFHSTVNVVCESMTVSISNTSIQTCYHEGFPTNYYAIDMQKMQE